MVQSQAKKKNALHDLGYKIFLDRYALKDMKRETLTVGDLVIVVVNSATGQREVGRIKAINMPTLTIELLDGEVVTRDIEHVDKPLETDPAQMMDRVAAGIAAVEKTAKKRSEWAKNFRWLLEDWKFVPGGRILTAAGTDQELTFYNCMPPEQEVLTADGYKPIADVRLGEMVVTHKNRLRPVLHKFERETEEEIYTISAKKIGYDVLRVTGEHKIYVIRSEWVNANRRKKGLRLVQEPTWIPASQLKKGDFVALAYDGEICPPSAIRVSDYLPQYRVQDGKLFKPTTRGEHGYVSDWGTHFSINDTLEIDDDLCFLFGRWLGDGCITHRTKTDIPSGIKIVFALDEREDAERIANIIREKLGIEPALKTSSTGRWLDLWVNSMTVGEFFKALFGAYSHSKLIPSELMHLNNEQTLALLHGLFSSDGYISKDQIGILLANHKLCVQIHQLLLRLGYFFSIFENTHKNGRVASYRLTAPATEAKDLFQKFFNNTPEMPASSLQAYIEHDGLRWVRIEDITTETYRGMVMDIEVEEDHSFVSAGLVVSNCYVIPMEGDSRGGIIETLGNMTEIMSRGGGVGINLSTLRPRHAYVKGVNGRSSGSVSWGALYSFVTGLIEQGGCFGPDEHIATDKGLIPAKELADRIDAGEIFYAHTHKGLRQITARFRNGIKPLYEVKTSRGYSVKITQDHKVAVLADGKITTTALKYLQEGDEILLLEGIEELVGELELVNGMQQGNNTEKLPYATPDTIASITPIGESDVYDFEVDEVHLLSANGIYTSNSRRGALMLILNDWHPDVFDFINSKREAGKITNANISVGLSDRFMDAMKADADWDLQFPDTSHPDYDTVWDGDLEKWIASGREVITYKTIKARDLWNAIIESAWASAEPGVWFRERSNKMSNSWYFNPLIATNPCVTGDTRIYTDKGLVTARELFEEETEIEVAIDGRFGLDQHTVPATRVFMTGTKPVFRVQTREGYFVRATADHRFMTPRGWVELRHLQEGDKIHILNRKGGFGQEGTLELGRTLGWLVGDGTIKVDSAILSFFGEEKQTLAPMFAEYVDAIAQPLTSPNAARTYHVGVIDIAGRDEARVQSQRLRTLVETYGLVENKLQVPEIVFKGTEEMQRGFLQALFTADGSVQYANGMMSVRLASSHYPLLEQVQMLLSNFGIACKIYRNRRDAQYRDMPDGKGGLKSYPVKAEHELVITKYSVQVFADEINFILPRKQDTLASYLSRYTKGFYRESFCARVESITSDGIEDVFDLTEPITHSLVCNSLITHNCGEQSLGAFSVCNLGAINLAKFYDEDAHDVLWDDLEQTVKYAVRFLDNVIDVTPYFFEENRKVQLAERRVGLGTMGVAELMLKLHIRYGSDESVEFIDKLYKFMAVHAYKTSSVIAKEKGVFPQFDAEKFLQSGFMLGMPDDVRQQIVTDGIRNVTLLTQAPTGCVAPDTLVSTSTGLQPIVNLGNPDGAQWQPLNREVYTDVGLRQTSQFYVNGTQPVKKITTNRGFSITATHNHRIRVIDECGNYVWRRMDELRVGDTAVLKKNTLGDGEYVPLIPVEQGNRAMSLLPTHMTSEFAELLGLYMGDGYTKKRGGLHIVVSQKDPDLLEHVKALMQTVWGERAVPVEERIGCWVANLTGYYIGRFFEANDMKKPIGNHGEGAAGAFIPNKVLAAGREAVKAFLRGLFEADGSVHRGTVTFVSTSENLVKQVQIALLGLGIVSTIRQMPKQDDRYGERVLYELRLLNRRECEKFAQEVNFISQRKQAKLADLGAISDRGDSINHPELLKSFYAHSESIPSAYRQKIRGLISNGALTQHSVKQYVQDYPMLAETPLAQLVSLDVYLDTILTIEDGVSATYDLSVPDNHTYIANGFVSHNTTGTLVNTSTGIEPFFSWVYYRKSRLGLHEEQVPIAKEWYDANPNAKELPDYFVTAMDLIPTEHVKVQGAFQRWIDSAISKTANLPNNYTIQQTAELYEYMYELGCKGGTVYRDGSRDEQVLMLKGDERAEKENEAKSKKEEKVEQVATPHRVYPRPKKLHGVTMNTQTPFGTAYITMNSDEQGYPFEVFITAPGKAGSDLQADAEGLGRMISLSLRTTEPHNRREMLRLIIDQLRDIGGARSIGFGMERVISLPDAVARALEDNYFPKSESLQLQIPMMDIPMTKPVGDSKHTNGNGHDHQHEIIDYSGADLCPSCGTISLIRAEGCRRCVTCGYTEC